MRDELGGDYDVRAAGFAFATTSPSKQLMMAGARQQAVEAFIGPLFKVADGFVMPYVYAGTLKRGSFVPCLLAGA